MMHTDMIEQSFAINTETFFLRCLSSIPKRKSGDLITSGQYLNYQAFTYFYGTPLLENSFHGIRVHSGDPSRGKVLFVTVGFTGLVLMFLRRPQERTATRNADFPYYRVFGKPKGLNITAFSTPENFSVRFL